MTLGDEWYERVAKSRPPKNEPCYHVLVDNAVHTTYVAQQNLEPSIDVSPVDHPEINNVFDHYADGSYLLNKNRLQ